MYLGFSKRLMENFLDKKSKCFSSDFDSSERRKCNYLISYIIRAGTYGEHNVSVCCEYGQCPREDERLNAVSASSRVMN